MEKILVVVPTFNEMENLPWLVAALEKLNLGIHVLIVDDNSPDGTGEWAQEQSRRKEHVHVLRRARKLGLGSAYVAGFRFAAERGYDLVFEMDADFSHHPRYIPDFLEAAKTHDLVIGSRYITGVSVVHWPMSRLLLSWFANKYARWVTGLPIQDCTAGYKCFRVQSLRVLNLDTITSDGYSFQIEVTYKLWKKGIRMVEIPIVFADRTAGVSKMSSGIVREALFLLVRLRLGG